MRTALTLLALLGQDLVSGEPRKLGGEMRFTEGPIADAAGHVYFSDIPNNRIMKWDGRRLTTWREDSNGSNGLRFDKDGSLVVCEGAGKRVTRVTMDQKVSVLAETFDGKPFNSPNDLCLDAKGGVYFTDPNYRGVANSTQDVEGVYYIPPGGGRVVRVAADLQRPNGIEMGKDRIFVADHRAGKVYSYAVGADGGLADRKEFCAAVVDGMKLDAKGKLWAATREGIEVFGPDGKRLGAVKVPEGPSNCCFFGKTLYITARTSFYSVETK